MPLSPADRITYLDTLDHAGGDEARQEGLKLLQLMDQGKPLPPVPRNPAAAQVATIDSVGNALNLSPEFWGKGICLVKCLPHAVSQDWPGLAACVLDCILKKL